LRPFDHTRPDVHADHAAAVLAGQEAGCRSRATAHVQHVRALADVAELGELLCSRLATKVFGQAHLGGEIEEGWLALHVVTLHL